MNEILKSIKTPAYVCEEAKVRKNLELLKYVKEQSGAKILVALKGFAFSGVMDLVGSYLDGATCSGLHEAKFASEYVKGEIHTYSPAFKDEDFDEILKISKHITFNSFAQWQKFKGIALQNDIICGLRVNPEVSLAPTDSYNPCGKFSRLGITRANFKPELLEGITGLHFHALCEESASSLQVVLEAFEEKFGEFIPKMKWINMGEPGEAVGWQTGFLISSVLDIVHNEKDIAILDTSAEAHMPDTVLMPYRPAVRGESENGRFAYRFGGNTCLAGDIVGLEAGDAEYKFDSELKIGDRVIFEDQIHYTIVKNTTFNGIKLPDLLLLKENGEIKMIREFGYEEYRRRN